MKPSDTIKGLLVCEKCGFHIYYTQSNQEFKKGSMKAHENNCKLLESTTAIDINDLKTK